ncbi:Lrp/AsnC family transcriptional regulator [Flectobacillus longus]|uniref:Lrp/AsnC family transcriptional regulator n=1 Tax=Flectobacillus longus TaxID=2984207 RepID=UPI0024B7013A|nr:Lrp/AsnC family transcriptional regulator [Flectobacillus longus]MDI9879632.1 Lrp/AsnC family transcriptional regulator [Flectobacillus longus]
MLDPTDQQILQLLQQNAKLTIKELAEMLNLTTSPVFERIKRLEKDGVISGYVALVNPEKTGRGQVVFCNISMPIYTHENIDTFEQIVQNMSEVIECYHLAGTVDYQLKVYVKDIKEYDGFLRRMAEIPSIKVHSSTVVLHHVKYTTAVPVD